MMTTGSERKATVVLVHGAFHGGWCWDRVTPGLAAAGVDTGTIGAWRDAGGIA